MQLESVYFILSNFCDFAVKLSKKAHDAAKNEDIDQMEIILDNRCRVIQTIEQYQEKVISITEESPTSENKDLLNLWFLDVSRFVSTIDAIDSEITHFLNQSREKIIKEIGVLSSSKKVINGYNLQTTK